jgi:hypothetical protein
MQLQKRRKDFVSDERSINDAYRKALSRAAIIAHMEMIITMYFRNRSKIELFRFSNPLVVEQTKISHTKTSSLHVPHLNSNCTRRSPDSAPDHS